MKLTSFLPPLSVNSFHILAVVLWLSAAGCSLWFFQWQEQVDVNIRQHLVRQSEQAVQQINQSLAKGLERRQVGQLDNEFSALDSTATRQHLRKQVNRAVLNLGLGAQGFAVLIARSGELLAYPDSSLLGKNIYQDSISSDPLLDAIVKQLPRGQLMTFEHPVTKKEQWMVLKYIPSLDADLGLVIDVGELRNSSAIAYLPWNGLLLLVLSGLIIWLGTWRFPANKKRMSRRVFVILSICMLSFLSALWYEALADISLHKGETQLVNRESAELAWRRAVGSNQGAFEDISQPLQLVIHSINLSDANEVHVSGNVIVAGRYESPPLQLKDTLASEWRLQRQSQETQVWHFIASLKQSMDYDSFPFDRDVLTLIFLPAPEDKRPLLVPLFEAYASMAPQALPGLAVGSNSVGGWHLEQTYFSYQSEALYPNRHFLNLKYNIVIQRSLTGPLISHIMPLFVVSFLTYCMLLIWTRDKDKQELWGFSTATVLEYSASLFFILVISHVALRDTLNAQGVVFIEYFYFISYLQIIFIAIGALFYTSDLDVGVISQEKSMLIKKWYWPCVFFLCIAITLMFLK